MKRLYVLAIILSSSTIAFAQHNQSAQPQDPTKNAPATPTADITVRGCISGGERYTFMQADTGEIYSLSGNTGRLVPMLGKLVEINAREFSPQPNTDDLPRLEISDPQITDARIIADKCPIHPHPEPSATPVSPAHQPPQSSPSDRPYTDPGTTNQAPPNVNNPNISGDTGTPSPGTGNPPPSQSQPQPPPQ